MKPFLSLLHFLPAVTTTQSAPVTKICATCSCGSMDK
jgi:hypothetical protein